MKTIWFDNEEIMNMVAEAGIDMVCDERMNITIADEDVAKVAEVLGEDNAMLWGVEEHEEETTGLIGTSFNVKNFEDMKFGVGTRVVAIVNAHNPHIMVFGTKDMTQDEIMDMIKAEVRNLTICCAYKYHFVEKVGNTYFFN